MEKKWDSQLDALAMAYLAWKHDTAPVDTTETEFTVRYVDIFGQPLDFRATVLC
jgi:hypothetical protein